MSANIVEKAHIDYLIEAGLELRSFRDSPLRWHVPESPLPTDYERGEVTGRTGPAHAEARRRELTEKTTDAVGAMLIAQNERSLNHRYDGEYAEVRVPYHFERGGPYVHILGRYEDGWRWKRVRVEPVSVLSAIACYEYQSCEDPGWESSEARAFCNALRHAAIRKLPGYEGAVWAIQGAQDPTEAVEVRA